MLHRLGDDHDLWELEELAIVGKAVLSPGLSGDIHPFNEPVPGLGNINTVDIEFPLLITASNAHHNPTARDDINGRQILS